MRGLHLNEQLSRVKESRSVKVYRKKHTNHHGILNYELRHSFIVKNKLYLSKCYSRISIQIYIAPAPLKGPMMYKSRSYQILFSILGCALLFLLAACGSSGSTPGTGSAATSTTTIVAHNTPTTTTSGATPTTPSSSSLPMPPTQTSCPAAGTARAAVTATLALGAHPNIVYIVNGPTHLGTLKRYDVTTGAKTEIVNLANTSISSAQLSADGQWILFVAISGRQAKL